MALMLNLEDLDADIKEVPDADTAKLICDSAIIAHRPYWRSIKAQQEHMDGKPPYDPAKLKENKQNYRNNWSHNKASAKSDKIVSDSVLQIMGALSAGSVTFREFNLEKDKDKEELSFLQKRTTREMVGRIISKVFAETFDRERRSLDFISRIEYNSENWGWCAVTHDPKDWMGHANNISNIAFKNRTHPDQIELYIIFDLVTPMFLYEKWRKFVRGEREVIEKNQVSEEKEKYVNFWNKDGLEEALWHSLSKQGKKKDDRSHYKNWEEIAPSYIKNPAYYCQMSDLIPIAKIFSKERDGSVTHSELEYSFTEVDARGEIKKRTKGHRSADHFLYKRQWKNKEMDDFITIIRSKAMTASGSIQDLRGIAKFAVADSIRYNRRRNQLDDNLDMSAGLHFRPRNANQSETFQIEHHAGFIIHSPNFESVPDLQSPRLQEHITAMQFDEIEYNRETSHFDPSIKGRIGNRANRSEVSQVSQEVAREQQRKSIIKIRDWELFLTKAIKRISLKNLYTDKNNNKDLGYDGHKDFIKEVKKALKLDEDQVYTILSTIDKFTIEFVNTDPNAILEALKVVSSDFGRNVLSRQYLYALGFPRKTIDTLLASLADSEIITNDTQLAFVENGLFEITGEVPVAEGNDNENHLNIHYPKFDQKIESLSQGADAAGVFQYLNRGLAHTAVHIENLGKIQVAKETFEGFVSIQDDFEDMAEQVRALAEKQAKEVNQAREQEAQGQSAIPPEVLADIQRKQIESREKMRRQQESHEQKKQNSAEQNANKINNANEESRARIRNEAKKIALKIQSDNLSRNNDQV